MCCSNKKIDGINHKQEQCCGNRRQHRDGENHCCAHGYRNDDLSDLQHLLDCYSGKVKELRSRIAEMTNEKE